MKGQITLFIILGIVILFSLSITVYLGVTLSSAKEQKEHLSIQPIKDYVNSCLDFTTNQGLTLLGKQGGFLYKSQGGVSNEPLEFVEYNDASLGLIKIPFLVLPPKDSVGDPPFLFSSPPRYPFDSFPYAGDEILMKGYYGISSIPPLYKLSQEGVPVADSIQENLEKFIEHNILSCVSWDVFEPKGFSFVSGNPSASLVFAETKFGIEFETGFAVELNWSIDISSPDGVFQMNSFVSRLPVRLASIYFKMKQIIDSDATDVSYSPSSDLLVGTQEFGENSIVLVEDAASKIDSSPYKFIFARKNRIPALWYVNPQQFESAVFHITPEGRGASVLVQGNVLSINDPCQVEGTQNPFIVELKASDPDEDDVIFDVEVYGGSDAEISSIGENKIKIFAKDGSSSDIFDSQEISLKTALCEVR